MYNLLYNIVVYSIYLFMQILNISMSLIIDKLINFANRAQRRETRVIDGGMVRDSYAS